MVPDLAGTGLWRYITLSVPCLQLMWFENYVCGLFADNVASFSINVVLRAGIFAINLVSKSRCLRF